LNVILDVFNSLHEWQFTIEVSNGNTLSFLDIRIIVKNNVIMLDRYKKSTFFGKIFELYLSASDMPQERSCAWYD